MKLENYSQNEIEKLNQEIESVKGMTEKEVQDKFNADSKEEYLQVLRDELKYYTNHIDD